MGLFGWAYELTDSSGAVVETGFPHVLFGVVYSLGWVIVGGLLWSKGTERSPSSSRS
jgi:hypothetical protein